MGSDLQQYYSNFPRPLRILSPVFTLAAPQIKKPSKDVKTQFPLSLCNRVHQHGLLHLVHYY